jgi:hypothetical protein
MILANTELFAQLGGEMKRMLAIPKIRRMSEQPSSCIFFFA